MSPSFPQLTNHSTLSHMFCIASFWKFYALICKSYFTNISGREIHSIKPGLKLLFHFAFQVTIVLIIWAEMDYVLAISLGWMTPPVKCCSLKPRMEAAQMLLEDSCSGAGQTWGSEDCEKTQMTAQDTEQLCESRHVHQTDLFKSLKVVKKKSGEKISSLCNGGIWLDVGYCSKGDVRHVWAARWKYTLIWKKNFHTFYIVIKQIITLNWLLYCTGYG